MEFQEDVYSIISNKNVKKMKIYLRKRLGNMSKISAEKGKLRMVSLLLVYYHGASKKREYEFLNLYLYHKPLTNLQKEHNKETLQLAEAIRAKKLLDYQSSSHGFISSVKGKINFLTYFEKEVEKRYNSDGNYGNWHSAFLHLTAYCKGKDISIDRVDDAFLEGFKQYLLSSSNSIKMNDGKLSQNTASSYFNKVRTALREAYNNKLIRENPTLRVKCIKEEETHREYLTFEELKLLAKTECKVPLLKRAFLFSALTGLRFSDVKNLKWKNIQYDKSNGYSLVFTQKKTKGAENLPVGEQAINLLGERKNDEDSVFENMQYISFYSDKLSKWISEAGITKHITFHCARHSFATLQLTLGTDIYTVSKMLGHKHLKTTEIYGQIISKKKIDAASRIPELI